jgi:hypothetical protein
MLATQHSMGNSLRWMRRLIVVILIITNFMAIILADAAYAAQNTQSIALNVWNQQGFNVFTHDNLSTAGDDIAISFASGETEENVPRVSIATR